MDSMYLMKQKKQTAILLLVDFSKAFDSINHDFIYNALRTFNFGPNFIKGIKLLLTDRESAVNVGGHLTKNFPLERGVPQGDPISAYLFILAIELLNIAILNNPKIKKVHLTGDTRACQNNTFVKNL